MFQWTDFLDRHNIAYELQGKHARTRCPFCTEASERRMAIDLTGKGWWCWVGRKEHSGINPNRLVASFLGISLEAARAITGSGAGFAPDADEFSKAIAALRAEPAKPFSPPPQLRMPAEFKRIDNGPVAEPFVHYLRGRGFTDPQIMRMTDCYGLRCCLDGYWRYRLIFPIVLDGRLVAWTGRTIAVRERKRYLAEGQAPHYLLWFDQLKKGGQSIVLAEGPFDALKLRFLGQPATCFFTAAPSEQQIDLLGELLPRYRERFLLLDRNTTHTSLRVREHLACYGVAARFLPEPYKDPAELANHAELQQILYGSKSP